MDISVCITAPFFAPNSTANFVVFTNEVPFVPFEEAEEYFKRCKAYAKKHEVYLVSGLVAIGNYLCLFMFDRSGKLCGAQRALFLHKNLRSQFKRCADITLFDTDFGKVYLCVDVDVYHPETARYAKLCGCNLMVCSQYISSYDYSQSKLYFGAWNAAQQNQIFVVAATNEESCICVPSGITEQNNGYLVRPSSKMPLRAVFAMDDFKKLPGRLSGQSFNRALYQNYLMDLER